MSKGFLVALAGLAIFAFPGTAAAQSMPVSTFLAKADALKARGMTAMFSRDIGLLKAEVTAAATSYRTDVAAGKQPRSCPPPKGTVQLTADELLAYFRTIPTAQQTNTSVRTAFFDYATRRFPCRR